RDFLAFTSGDDTLHFVRHASHLVSRRRETARHETRTTPTPLTRRRRGGSPAVDLAVGGVLQEPEQVGADRLDAGNVAEYDLAALARGLDRDGAAAQQPLEERPVGAHGVDLRHRDLVGRLVADARSD